MPQNCLVYLCQFSAAVASAPSSGLGGSDWVPRVCQIRYEWFGQGFIWPGWVGQGCAAPRSRRRGQLGLGSAILAFRPRWLGPGIAGWHVSAMQVRPKGRESLKIGLSGSAWAVRICSIRRGSSRGRGESDGFGRAGSAWTPRERLAWPGWLGSGAAHLLAPHNPSRHGWEPITRLDWTTRFSMHAADLHCSAWIVQPGRRGFFAMFGLWFGPVTADSVRVGRRGLGASDLGGSACLFRHGSGGLASFGLVGSARAPRVRLASAPQARALSLFLVRVLIPLLSHWLCAPKI